MRILGEIQSNYRILISRGESPSETLRERRPRAYLYAFSLRDAIPSFSLPFQSGESEPMVELQSLLNGVYERAGYDLRLDYTQEPVPKLKPEDATWVHELLKAKRLRNAG
ncbi:hypothetical protein MiSe_79910 [Microseira wollei NIES-4236]|uniref:DUF4058 family protein n=1 Tax=Microseira wollei NIES-4236 TaxID=2530354 RepID=A0AAV3XPV1_9CYAN|nr:hypothetical protein MiSe_79910 [Microseira wollei NIES-4236]